MTRWSSVLILTFVMASSVVHIAQPSFNPVDVALSYYINGHLGWALAAGLVALGVGSLLLVAATYGTFGGRVPRRWLVLLGLWGVGCVLGGLFPPDVFGEWNRPPSLSGAVHGIAAITAFLAFPVAAVCLSRLYVSPAGSPLSLPGQVAALCAAMTVFLFVCLTPAFQNRPPYALGFVERIALGCNVCWLLLANRAVRNTAAAQER